MTPDIHASRLRRTPRRPRRNPASAGVLLLLGASLAQAGDVSVRIYERGGKAPMANVSVCLGTPADIDQFGAARTGADGTVVFRSVPRSQVVVTASRPGYMSGRETFVTTNTNRMLVMSLPVGGGGPQCTTRAPEQPAASAGLAARGFRINNGARVTTTPQVSLDHGASGGPTHYRVSEDPEFTGASWQVYEAKPRHRLSEGNGRKVVYFQLRRLRGMDGADLEVRSPVVRDSITLQGD